MKYANSLKYIESFKSAGESGVSRKRIAELCTALGKINVGARFIHTPGSVAGHGCGVLFEHCVKCAGYKIGRVIDPRGLDSRSCVFINCEIPSIEDYNKCVAELKSKVGKASESEYLKEEIAFVLSLLLCFYSGCEFIILEGTDKYDRVCAPYELTVIPTLYGGEAGLEQIKPLCDAIRCGTREVVSGNQKSDVYNYISNVCAPAGQRLFIPVKSQFELTEVGARRVCFNYNGRDGFVLKTPSLIMRDCAMTVIEAIFAVRREGIRLPVSAMISGISEAGSCGSFELVSYSPTVISDNAVQTDEVAQTYKTLCEIFGEDKSFSVCIPADMQSDIDRLLSALPTDRLEDIYVYTHNFELSYYKDKPLTLCRTHKDMAKHILSRKEQDCITLILGGAFSGRVRDEIKKLVDF